MLDFHVLKQGPDFHFEISGYSMYAKSRLQESTVVATDIDDLEGASDDDDDDDDDNDDDDLFTTITVITLNIDILTTYHTCPKNWTSPFYYLLMS